MFKQMLKPGALAGVIGGIVSLLVSVLLTLALLLPGQTGITLYCLSSPLGILLSFGIGLLAAFLAQRQSPEKLIPSKSAVAGVIAGVVSTIIGLIALPITQQLPNWLNLQDKMIEVQLAPSRLMGLSEEQLELARAQIVAMQKGGMTSSNLLAGMAAGMVCGLVAGVALGAGGAAVGALIFKPSLRRKLTCEKCQAKFDLGGNAYIQVREGSPDLVDYCNWDDFMPDAARRQRETIAQILKPAAAGQARQWQCGMCKTIQTY